MAKLLDKTFDTAHGAIIVRVQDEVPGIGNVTVHTLYLNGTPDVNAAIAQIETDADTNAQVIHDKLVAAGWTPNGNQTSAG